jgi:hypothetical protein
VQQVGDQWVAQEVEMARPRQTFLRQLVDRLRIACGTPLDIAHDDLDQFGNRGLIALLILGQPGRLFVEPVQLLLEREDDVTLFVGGQLHGPLHHAAQFGDEGKQFLVVQPLDLEQRLIIPHQRTLAKQWVVDAATEVALVAPRSLAE